MKVLWLCNIVLPIIAKQLGIEASNKEGWLSGLADALMRDGQESGIELAIAAPLPKEQAQELMAQHGGKTLAADGKLVFYGFWEETACPELYPAHLEDALRRIVDDFAPDVVHCFGTEYPHTLAMCRVVPEKKKLLVGIQGLCAVYADAYFADLPKCVVRSVTLRDFLKQDSLREQQKKFVMRGEMEIEAIKLSGNITGRTHWDKHHTAKWNPKAIYHEMNETLRPDFYEAKWDKEACEPHSIFLSQGDYPIKGLHYMVEAMPQILESYPDAKVYVAGNSLLREGSLVQKLKISAYGRYLTKLLKKYRLQEKFIFLGRLNADQMKAQYLKSHLFVCPSSIENSPNSLGEAMLLGMPCVSADVGGIASIFTDGEDGLLYEGFLAQAQDAPARRKQIAKNLADAVESIWSDETRMLQYCESARAHAMKTHNKECNLARLKEIYASMVEENKA